MEDLNTCPIDSLVMDFRRSKKWRMYTTCRYGTNSNRLSLFERSRVPSRGEYNRNGRTWSDFDIDGVQAMFDASLQQAKRSTGGVEQVKQAYEVLQA